ncbi:MAG: bifunctional metallophosphatase/5'-nucleotidase, partial [Clostridia bacterium]|nr:bifunctional metallophosphatase/5'-nucleotidase [Clostridia bacterium]
MQKKLTILHCNDIHGDFLPKRGPFGMYTGGLSRLSGYVKKVRAEEENVIFANAGDMFRGSVIDSEFMGLSTIELMNMLSPDVTTVGNHEVDYGLAHLLFLEKCAKFPIINADLYITLNNTRLFRP